MFPALVADPPGRGALAGGVPRPHAPGRAGQRARQRLPRRDVSVGGRRARQGDHAALRRAERAAPRSTSTATSPWRSGSTTSPPATPPGSRARGFRSSAEPPTSGSAARRYDSAGGRYHIRNVVSVAEGLVGVSDDAYTNAVARRNLEIATAAARRLGADGRPALGRGRREAPPADRFGERLLPDLRGRARLHARRRHPAAGLSPRRSDERRGQARAPRPGGARASKDEAAGAMMGITLLSVGAAELGDRRLVDSLLPFSYRHHLKGPFLMLSETPTNNAVELPDRRRRLPAAGDLRLHRPPARRARAGAGVPTRAALSRQRLLLRTCQSGERIDVLVDSTGDTSPSGRARSARCRAGCGSVRRGAPSRLPSEVRASTTGCKRAAVLARSGRR